MNKSSVFIIDKDINLLDTISKRFMLEPNCEVKGVAQTGFEAYQKIQTIKPDFVVINAPLFDLDIVQLINALKAIKQDTILIGVLDAENPALRQQLQSTGIKDIFIKPYDMENLVKTINGYIMKMNNTIEEQSFVSTFTMSKFGEAQNNVNQPQNPFNLSQPQNPINPQLQNPFTGASQYGGIPFGGGVAQPQPQMQPEPRVLGGGIMQQQPQMSMPMPMQVPMEVENSLMNNGGGFKTIKQSIIAINCPKGGVGKTTISTNIATALSMVKIGKQPLKVLLVDMDLDFGDACTIFNLQPRPNIMNWVSDINSRLMKDPNAEVQYTQAQIEQYLLTYPKTGLKILAAPPSCNDILDVTDKVLKIIIENLKSNTHFDVIIFDTGNNLNNHTLYTLFAVHSVFEIITMDVTAMKDLNTQIKSLRGVGFPMDKLKLVVNRLPKNDKEFSIEEISNALGFQNVVGVIPEYDKVRVRNNAGEPMVLDARDNPFTIAIKNLANTMIGVNLFSKSKSVSGGNSAKSLNPISDFFGKIFGKK